MPKIVGFIFADYILSDDSSSEEFNNKAYVIEFSPWFSKDRTQIMFDFLTTIRIELSPINPQIGYEIDNYIWLLSNLKLGTISDIARVLKSRNRLSLEQQFCQLNKCMKELDKPVFIIIDDVDRLMADEIMIVLQLVRNSANFANTVFFIPYDHDYIINTMQNAGVQNPESYLCKIINLPYNLPTVEYELSVKVHTQQFIEIANVAADEYTKNSIECAIREIGPNLTPRDVKRLASSVYSSVHNLRSDGNSDQLDLEIYDLILLENIKMSNPLLFSSLYFRADEMLSMHDGLLKVNIGDLSPTEYIRRFSYLHLPEDVAKRYYSHLEVLFPDNIKRNLNIDDIIRHSRINMRSFFKYYFEGSIDQELFTFPRFQEILDNHSLGAFEDYCRSLYKKDKDLLYSYLLMVKFSRRRIALRLLDNLMDMYILNETDEIPLIGYHYLGNADTAAQREIHEGVYREFLTLDSVDSNESKKQTILIILLYRSDTFHRFFDDNSIVFPDLLIKFIDSFVDFSTSWEEELIPYMRNWIQDYHSIICQRNNKFIEGIIKDKISNDLESFIGYINDDFDKFKGYPFRDVFGAYGNVTGASKYWKDNYPLFLEQQSTSIKKEQYYKDHIEFVKRKISMESSSIKR
ncbi:MAG: P-loop NTPase fold protein [Bacteroidales bacterium]